MTHTIGHSLSSVNGACALDHIPTPPPFTIWAELSSGDMWLNDRLDRRGCSCCGEVNLADGREVNNESSQTIRGDADIGLRR
jgi:hypothetical protein